MLMPSKSPRQSRQSKRFHASRSNPGRSSQFNSSQFKPSQFRTTQAHGWNDERGDDRPSEFRRDLSASAPSSGRAQRRAKVPGFWVGTALALVACGWAVVQFMPLLRH